MQLTLVFSKLSQCKVASYVCLSQVGHLSVILYSATYSIPLLQIHWSVIPCFSGWGAIPPEHWTGGVVRVPPEFSIGARTSPAGLAMAGPCLAEGET